MARTNLMAGIATMTAALSMAATPVAAADLPVNTSRTIMSVPGSLDIESANADGWRGHRGYRRHRGSGVGDVLAGVLIIGGIAAVASAASRSNDRNRRYPDRDYRYPARYPDRDYRAPNTRGDSRYDSSRGIDRAVSMCVGQIERDARVDTVDAVDRNGDGWRVTGSLYNGDSFTCRIGSDGRVDNIDFGGRISQQDGDFQGQNNQYDDERYRSARARIDSAPVTPAYSGQAPAYPGGPVAGDNQPEGDGRYSTADAGDFDS